MSRSRAALNRPLIAAFMAIALILLAIGALQSRRPAAAATGSLVAVGSFGSNPGNLQMYTYTPAGLPSNAPLVVAMHGCTQTANDYFTHSGWAELADTYKFAVVFPQQPSSNNSTLCFDWWTPSDDSRGVGEAASVKAMVDYEKSHLSIDSARVFLTGLSAGGAMTADLLADYPDVFAGGATDSGLPAQCATSQTQATNCQQNNQNLTPAQWAARVTAAYSGYSGPYPRVAIWQGTGDYIVYPVNGTELRDQWTAVHGVSQTPSSTQTLTGGTTETTYNDSAGTAQVAFFSIAGMGHGTAVHPGSGTDNCGSTGAYFLDYICSSYYTAQFWGLTGGGNPTTTPTTTSPSPTPTPTPTYTCVTASNYAQTQAGRAYQSGGYTYANGSNQNMGLWNTYVTHTLRQTGANYWVIADGQC
ncbi:MAG TPA: PHB depolymerase family esterase [Jatrophihabitans sp.]|nr:PHB depolymerase family esterase [Jatrophihabitans sp.]